MRRPWILILMSSMVAITSCDEGAGMLCKDEAAFKTYNYACLEVYGSLEDGLKCARNMERPIFLLFSGFACIGDNSYEEELFVDKKNRQIIAEHYVPIILFVDDKTQLREKDRMRVVVGGKERVINTVGGKNAHFQMMRFQSNTQPLFVILDPIGNQLLEPIGYQGDPTLYKEYLKEGLERYKLNLEVVL